jgi:hypothetical protein
MFIRSKYRLGVGSAIGSVLAAAILILGCKDAGKQLAPPPQTSSRAALGEAHTLSGRVFASGAGLPDSLVEALADGTTTVVGSSTTDGSGNYQMALIAATYDLRVTPAAASGFPPHTVQDVVMGDADTRHDVILISQSGGVSGRVLGHGAVAAVGAQVDIYTLGGGTRLVSLTTDADGHYQSSLAAGSYDFYVHSNGSPIPGTPSRSWYWYRNGLIVAGNTVIDHVLPVVRVAGRALDAGGAAIPNVIVTASSPFADAGSYGNGQDQVTTDAAGQYALILLVSGTASFVAEPPAGSPLSTLSLTGVALSADATMDLVLPPANPISGRVTGHAGIAVAGAVVDIYTLGGGTRLASLVADADGRYQTSLGDGSYDFYVHSAGAPLPGTPSRSWYWYRNGLVVAGSTVIDHALPVVRVEGRTTDAGGAPVSNVIVTASSPFNDSTSYGNGQSQVTSDGTGNYAFILLRSGTASFVAEPPAGSPLSTLSLTNVGLTGDATMDLVLPPANPISGQVTGHGGVAVAGAVVDIYTLGGGARLLSLTTDADGRYQAALGDGSYDFYIHSNGTPLPGTPSRSWYWYRNGLVIAGNTIINHALPVVRVEGRITDANGAPVPNVIVTGTSPFGDATSYGNGQSQVTSETAGHYTLFLLTGSASFTVEPPASTGFSTTALTNVSITSDLTQSVVLQRPDLAPPTIVSGPLVIHLSDTSVSINWTTNEASTSVVEYGLGNLANSTASPGLVTRHSVTLLGLDPLSEYSYRAGSTDASGNGPTWTGTLTFRTQAAPGDISPPVITSGPTVTFRDHASAVISWETDEPSTSLVEYGTSAALGSSAAGPAGIFTRSHAVTVSGLSPSTSYSARVSSIDPDGNGPTTSAIFAFTTTATPDTQAPVISAGPTIQGVTDTTITVAWTTSEPASSGVSYNDGTTFNLVNDPSFTSDHVITISGLTPGKTYHLTVSSTDPVGNGPTLAGPIDANTAATPDGTVPVLSAVAASEITSTSAAITWTTSEPATSAVRFGLVAGAPDGATADVALQVTHRLLLTGLLPGRRYYFVAESADSSGNNGVFAELSFATLVPLVDTDGDGIGDSVDNCPSLANPDQADGDSDGQGDACDVCPRDAANDADQDGLCGDVDACPTQHPGPVDANGDGCPDAVRLSIADASLTEGNSGGANLVFRVTLSAASASAVTVQYATGNGSATAPADYGARSGTLQFLPGVLSMNVTVPIKGETLFESDEIFVVNLFGAVGATVADGQANGTIVNDDSRPTVKISDLTSKEGNAATTKAVLTVSLSAASSELITVVYQTENGTGVNGAVEPSDYTKQTGTLTFNPGAGVSQKITILLKGDKVREPDETFVVRMTSIVNATAASANPAVVVIRNDD